MAWSAAPTEGAISDDLRAWPFGCLIHVAAADVDFHDQAMRGAREIPGAEFISIDEADQSARTSGPIRWFPPFCAPCAGTADRPARSAAQHIGTIRGR